MTRKPIIGEPAWEIARLFPNQGNWGEGDYFALTAQSTGLAELRDGRVEILATPTTTHQFVLGHLMNQVSAFADARKMGTVLFIPFQIRLRPELIRIPDLVFLRTEKARLQPDDIWNSADLVMEVLLEDEKSRHHDFVTKRREYAEAGVTEYWLVDPKERRVTVLTLEGDEYVVRRSATAGAKVTSAVLGGFELDVASLMKARDWQC